MLRYGVFRLFSSLLMVFILLTFVFLVLRVLPGDPARALLPPETPPETLDSYRRELGLDQPIITQFFTYFADVLQGNFGRSLAYHTRVSSLILTRLPATIELTFAAMLVGVSFGLIGGLVAVLARDTLLDHVVRVVTVVAASVPSFWLGLMFILAFGVYLQVLPTGGRIETLIQPQRVTGFMTIDTLLEGNVAGFLSALRHLALPAIELGLYSVAIIARVSRVEMLNELGKEYVLVLKAKGLRDRAIMKHVLRNALIPVITVIGLQMSFLLGGSVLTEVVFNIPGLGRLLIAAFLNRDYPLIQGTVIVVAIMVAVVMWIMDLSYYIVDPRIRQ